MASSCLALALDAHRNTLLRCCTDGTVRATTTAARAAVAAAAAAAAAAAGGGARPEEAGEPGEAGTVMDAKGGPLCCIGVGRGARRGGGAADGADVWFASGDCFGRVSIFDDGGRILWRGEYGSEARGGGVTCVAVGRDATDREVVVLGTSAGALAAASPCLGADESLWMVSADAVADGVADDAARAAPAGPSDEGEDDWERDAGNGVRCVCIHEYRDHRDVACVYILAAYDAPMRVGGRRRNLMVFTMAGALVGWVRIPAEAEVDHPDEGRRVTALCSGHFSEGARQAGRREVAAACDDGRIHLVDLRDAGERQERADEGLGVSAPQFRDLGTCISSAVALESRGAGPDRIACAGHFCGIAIVCANAATHFVDTHSWVIAMDALGVHDGSDGGGEREEHMIVAATTDGGPVLTAFV